MTRPSWLGDPSKSWQEHGLLRGLPPPRAACPTLENWDLPPFNRWSFQNVRSLIPTVRVGRGASPPSTFAREPRAIEGIGFETVSGAHIEVATLLAHSYTDGLLVLHRGRIVAERYENGMAPSSLHLSQSVAKSITGTVAGILVDQGRLDPEAPLVEYVPELSGCGYADARVTHVLDMTSGVRFTEDYGAPDSDMTRVDVAAGWRPHRGPAPRATIREIILTLPKVRAHGEVFEYRSIETDVLAWAMERAAGLPLAELVSLELWWPLGCEEDACFTVDGAMTAVADGGFNATLRDYGRFAQMHLDQGLFAGRQIVSATWVRSCRTGDNSIFGEPYDVYNPRGAYRRQFWVEDVERGTCSARGVFGQMIYIDPERSFAAVKLSTWPDYLNPELRADTTRALDAIARALEGR